MAKFASPAQINLITSKVTEIQAGLEVLPDGDPAAIAIDALLGTQEAALTKALGGLDLEVRDASTLIDVLFAAEKLVPPTTVRWTKEGDTWMLKGPAAVMVPGTQVATKTKKGAGTAWVGAHVRTEGHTVFTLVGEAPAPAAGEALSGLDLNPLFDGLTTESGDDRTDIWVADPTDTEGRLKLHLQRPRSGKWAGYIFVKDGAEYGYGQRYGMQRPGAAYSGDVVEALTHILADPHGAAHRYAELTSRCGVCNRVLEDETSVANKIGPVCAAKASAAWG